MARQSGKFLHFPPLSPRPPFHPGGVERGSEQPHLVLSLRLGHHWRLLVRLDWRQIVPARRCYPGRSVAEATKPNVAVGPPLSPAGRERGWGREWAKSAALQMPTSPDRALTFKHHAGARGQTRPRCFSETPQYGCRSRTPAAQYENAKRLPAPGIRSRGRRRPASQGCRCGPRARQTAR